MADTEPEELVLGLLLKTGDAVKREIEQRRASSARVRAQEATMHSETRAKSRAIIPPLASSDELNESRAMRRLGTSLGGKYTLSRLIGLGGMAAVYAGFHRNGHAVAIKVLHDKLVSDPEAERLFRREAQLANAVGHPGVTPVIDDDVTPDGHVFLVMPLLEGETVRARAQRLGGRLPVEEVVVIAHSVLETLAATHTKRIVHRDIKPENLFVTTKGEVKVLDFGIGRFFEKAGVRSGTRTGAQLGTPAFMAPEQALGRSKELDGLTDVWAVGATMFSLLSGKFVHDAQNVAEAAVMAGAKPARLLETVAPEVPGEIRAVVDRALSFERAARWPSAEAMARALEKAWKSVSGGSIAESPRLEVPIVKEGGEGGAEVPTAVPQMERPAAPLEVGPLKARGGEGGRKGRWGRVAMWIAGVGAALGIGGFGATRWGTRGMNLGAGVPVVVAVDAAVESEDLAALRTDVTFPVEAVREFRAGVQLWRDASGSDAIEKFSAAARIAPDFAAAHLWYVVALGFSSAEAREHYTSAAAFRTSMTTQQARVLNALGPLMSDPPDYVAATQRWLTLAPHHESDVVLGSLLARIFDLLGKYDDERAVLAPILAQADAPALPFRFMAEVADSESDAEAVRAALRQCIERSPTASDCTFYLGMLEAREGKCHAYEEVCRMQIARAPTNTYAYRCLADALFSSGASWEQISSSEDEVLRHAREDERRLLRSRAATWTAIARGRLRDAQVAAIDATNDVMRSERGSFGRQLVFATLTDVSAERGEAGAAIAAARQFVDLSRSWSRTTFGDTLAAGLSLRAAAGDLTALERTALRQKALDASAYPSYGSEARRWGNIYLGSVVTKEDALLAIAHMPPWPNGSLSADRGEAYMIGRMFALAGDADRARPFLERSSRSCGMEDDLFRTKAKLELAQLSEANKPQACALYGDIQRHWAPSPESRTVIAAKARAKALGCTAEELSKPAE